MSKERLAISQEDRLKQPAQTNKNLTETPPVVDGPIQPIHSSRSGPGGVEDERYFNRRYNDDLNLGEKSVLAKLWEKIDCDKANNNQEE